MGSVTIWKKECVFCSLKIGTLSQPHITSVSWPSSTQFEVKLKTNYPSSCLRIQALLILRVDS